MSNRTSGITRIIACAVFKPALENLRLEDIHSHLRVTYLPSRLHLMPQELKYHLLKEIMKAVERNEQVICLYGDCFPDIDDLCRQHGAIKVPGHYCYEMLLGSECFYRFLEDTAGTYFLERDLILNFDEYCLKPLELSDDEMRRYYFQRYRRLIYIRQPADPELSPDAARLAEFLGLSLHVQDADYSYLEGIIKELL